MADDQKQLTGPLKLHVLWRNGTRREMTGDTLSAFSSDPLSWFNYLIMTITGRPAKMRVRRNGQLDRVDDMLVALRPPQADEWPSEE